MIVIHSPTMRKTQVHRLLEKVTVGDGCWEFTGCKCFGYGYIRWDGKQKRTHRVMYELLVGPIPVGTELDHLCRNRACCRPDHLEVVTTKENLRRGVGWAGQNAQKTHCVNGHEFTPENTYQQKGGWAGGRGCIECRKRISRESQRRRWANNREELLARQRDRRAAKKAVPV
jgi:hypothetical protein